MRSLLVMIATIALAARSGSTSAPLSQSISAPMFLMQGDADEVLPVQNSRHLEPAFRALGRPVQAHYFPGASHWFMFEPPWHANAMARLAAFLRTTLKP